MTSKNSIAVWDFTLPGDFGDKETLNNWLREKCKKWTYQLEKGASGYIHYQGRISLKNKTVNIC